MPASTISVRGDENLSQAQTAVASGNLVVGENLKPFGGEHSLEPSCQIHVVERPAAEADAVQSAALPQGHCDVHESIY